MTKKFFDRLGNIRCKARWAGLQLRDIKFRLLAIPEFINDAGTGKKNFRGFRVKLQAMSSKPFELEFERLLPYSFTTGCFAPDPDSLELSRFALEDNLDPEIIRSRAYGHYFVVNGAELDVQLKGNDVFEFGLKFRGYEETVSCSVLTLGEKHFSRREDSAEDDLDFFESLYLGSFNP